MRPQRHDGGKVNSKVTKNPIQYFIISIMKLKMDLIVATLSVRPNYHQG